MKSFKSSAKITLPFGLAFAQVVIIKLFDLGSLPRLLSFEPGCRRFSFWWPWLVFATAESCLFGTVGRDAKVLRFQGLAEP